MPKPAPVFVRIAISRPRGRVDDGARQTAWFAITVMKRHFSTTAFPSVAQPARADGRGSAGCLCAGSVQKSAPGQSGANQRNRTASNHQSRKLAMRSTPSTLLGSPPLARLLLLANALLWLTFAVYFFAQSHPWKPHQKVFEEVSPPYIFWGRAFPVDQYMSSFMRATRLIQAPSFYAATPFFWYFNNRGILVDDLCAGVSIGGYYLVVVCLLSFAQWYLAGRLIDRLWRR